MTNPGAKRPKKQMFILVYYNYLQRLININPAAEPPRCMRKHRPSRSDGAEPADAAGCCEADRYPPATELFEEPQQLLMEPEGTTATPPSAAQIVSKTPDEDSACEKDTRCPGASLALLTSGARTCKNDLFSLCEGLIWRSAQPRLDACFHSLFWSRQP